LNKEFKTKQKLCKLQTESTMCLAVVLIYILRNSGQVEVVTLRSPP